MSSDTVAKTTIKVTPPGMTEPVDIEIDFMAFTLAERNLAKKAVAQLTEPDLLEIYAVNAWVVWRRTHPECKIDDWFNGITFGEMLGLVNLDELLAQPFSTPDEYSPEA